MKKPAPKVTRNPESGPAASAAGTPRPSGPRPGTVARYREALERYVATDESATRICQSCGVPLRGFLAYLYKWHRDLLLARHGVACTTEQELRRRLAGKRGQTPAAHARYREAIAACDDEAFIELNVSQIARRFGVDPTGLGNQLRRHYPEIVERRERERRRRGLSDNQPRGVRAWCREQYAGAVELLRNSEMTIPEAAAACGVSEPGLSQHLLYYHRELLDRRFAKRESARGCKRPGCVTGNGQRHQPQPETRERYGEAVRLYRETTLTVRAIADRLGLSRNALTAYLRTWCRETAFARRDAASGDGAAGVPGRHYLLSTAAKYAPAVERLRRGGCSTAEVAAEFGLQAESFRAYLREHFPELYARQGMVRGADGRALLQRSREKYAEAIRLYETTDEPLKSIAQRLHLTYNSLGGYLRRNFPELVARRGGHGAKAPSRRGDPAPGSDSEPRDT